MALIYRHKNGIFEAVNFEKPRIVRIYREIQGLETIQKTGNCKSANYESANCEDSLYLKFNKLSIFRTLSIHMSDLVKYASTKLYSLYFRTAVILQQECGLDGFE